MSETIADLMSRHGHPGKVEWIGTRPERRAPLVALQEVRAFANRGLDGDHRATRTGGKRQVTFVQSEHLSFVARLSQQESIDPRLLRRNIVVSGINLLALRTSRFQVGTAVFEGTDHCHPCSRMERALGHGGYNAMRGHGGITARVLEDGWIHVGDTVVWLAPAQASDRPRQLH